MAACSAPGPDEGSGTAVQRIDFEQMTATAAEAFATHGLAGIGMRELARLCGVSLPTLYYYFGSKEKLFEAVCDGVYSRALQTVRDGIDVSAAATTPLPAQLAALCRRLFTLLTTDRTLFLLLRQDLIHGSQTGENFRSRQQYEGLIEMFRKLLAARHPPEAAQRLAFVCAALIFGYCEFAVVSNRTDDGCDDLLAAIEAIATR